MENVIMTSVPMFIERVVIKIVKIVHHQITHPLCWPLMIRSLQTYKRSLLFNFRISHNPETRGLRNDSPGKSPTNTVSNGIRTPTAICFAHSPLTTALWWQLDKPCPCNTLSLCSVSILNQNWNVHPRWDNSCVCRNYGI